MKHFLMNADRLLPALLGWERTGLKRKRLLLEEAEREEAVLPRDDLRRGILFLKRLNLTAEAGREACVRYADDLYSESDRDRIAGPRREWISGSEFLSKAASLGYFRRYFLDAPEGPVRDLLAFLMTSPRPVPPSIIVRAFGRRNLKDISRALAACLADAAILLLWNPDGLDAEAGVWPHCGGGIAEAWSRPLHLVPREGQVFEVPASLDRDAEAVLAGAAFGGLRLRENGRELYRRETLRIAAEGYAGGTGGGADRGGPDPVIPELLSLGLLKKAGVPGKDLRLTATGRGMDWLVKSRAERLETFRGHFLAKINGLPCGPEALGVLTEVFGSGETYSVEDIICHGAVRRSSFSPAAGEEIRERALRFCLFSYLMPLGGLKTGSDDLAALSADGKRLLGLSERFPEGPPSPARIFLRRDGRIIVKGDDSFAGDKLLRFCSREDGGQPPVYRITAMSIARAAAEGIPADAVLYVLESLSGAPVPPALRNAVERRYRNAGRVSVLSGAVLECSSPAAARRVAVLGRGRVRKIGSRRLLAGPEVLTEEFAVLCRREGISFTDLRNSR